VLAGPDGCKGICVCTHGELKILSSLYVCVSLSKYIKTFSYTCCECNEKELFMYECIYVHIYMHLTKTNEKESFVCVCICIRVHVYVLSERVPSLTA
jgi:hypothetical protein